MKSALPLLTVMVIVFTSACGSPALTATQVPSPTSVDIPFQPAATNTPAASENAEVVITLKDNTITSSQNTFQAGVKYTFVITNSGRRAHNFNINPPVSVAGSLNAALDQALLTVPQEQLAIGATVTVEYIFPATAAGQQLEFSCLIRRHYDDGMRLSITVAQ